MINLICESGMNFIAYNTFHIETSSAYSRLKQEGFLSVEFLRIKDGHLWLIEAKSSFPNPHAPGEGKVADFDSEIERILKKFEHSLQLFSSIVVGVTDCELAEDFQLPERYDFMFCLVIQKFDIHWCNTVKKALRKKLKTMRPKIWELKGEIQVMTREAAIENRLILEG